ncbi:hypothetical protein BGZ47_011846 [Haplosporangium gracile]|nr:hypothetical protein BGZ47_011846 [Haplosporangium gracile]
MGRDLDEDIGQSGDEEHGEEDDEDTHNYNDQSNSIDDNDSQQDMMLVMDRLLEKERRNTTIHEQDELDHCQRIDDQSFIYSPYPSRRYHKDYNGDSNNGSDGDGDEGDIDDSNSIIDDRDTQFIRHRLRPRESYHDEEDDDADRQGFDEDEQGNMARWSRQQQLMEQQLLQEQQQEEDEEEMYEERDLDADIEVASSFGGGSDYDEYDHDECTSRYRTPSPQL